MVQYMYGMDIKHFVGNVIGSIILLKSLETIKEATKLKYCRTCGKLYEMKEGARCNKCEPPSKVKDKVLLEGHQTLT